MDQVVWLRYLSLIFCNRPGRRPAGGLWRSRRRALLCGRLPGPALPITAFPVRDRHRALAVASPPLMSLCAPTLLLPRLAPSPAVRRRSRAALRSLLLPSTLLIGSTLRGVSPRNSGARRAGRAPACSTVHTLALCGVPRRSSSPSRRRAPRHSCRPPPPATAWALFAIRCPRSRRPRHPAAGRARRPWLLRWSSHGATASPTRCCGPHLVFYLAPRVRHSLMLRWCCLQRAAACAAPWAVASARCSRSALVSWAELLRPAGAPLRASTACAGRRSCCRGGSRPGARSCSRATAVLPRRLF